MGDQAIVRPEEEHKHKELRSNQQQTTMAYMMGCIHYKNTRDLTRVSVIYNYSLYLDYIFSNNKSSTPWIKPGERIPNQVNTQPYTQSKRTRNLTWWFTKLKLLSFGKKIGCIVKPLIQLHRTLDPNSCSNMINRKLQSINKCLPQS